MVTDTKLYPLTVQGIRQGTRDARVVTFSIPENIKDTFRFAADQYLTLEHEIDGEILRRSYSIYSTPDKADLSIGAKRVEGGKFSGFVNDKLAVGDVISALPPTGSFSTPLDASHKKTIYLLQGVAA